MSSPRPPPIAALFTSPGEGSPDTDVAPPSWAGASTSPTAAFQRYPDARRPPAPSPKRKPGMNPQAFPRKQVGKEERDFVWGGVPPGLSLPTGAYHTPRTAGALAATAELAAIQRGKTEASTLALIRKLGIESPSSVSSTWQPGDKLPDPKLGGFEASTSAAQSPEAFQGAPPEHMWWNFPYKSFGAATGVALPVQVTRVSAGVAHGVVLTATGEAWSFGSGKDGQLGLGDVEDRSSPQFVRSLYGKRVLAVAAGGWHTVFTTNAGTYATGDNRFGQLGLGHTESRMLPALVVATREEVMVEAAAGAYHTLTLTAAGCVWACGSNKYRQLGIAECVEPFVDTPHPLLAFRSVEPAQIACGTAHSLFVTAGGDLWTWGRGDAGQLGHGDTNHVDEPKLVKSLVKYWMVSAGGGQHHTLACCDTGETFSFGTGLQGQLGLGKAFTFTDTPRQILSLSAAGDGAVGVACGGIHSLFRMRSGDLMTCGYGGAGRLGHDNQKTYWVPVSVRVLKNIGVSRDVSFFPFPDLEPQPPPTASAAEAKELSEVAEIINSLGDDARGRYTDAELIDMHRCFQQIDLDGGGSLDVEELDAAFDAMGEKVPTSEITAIIEVVDDNNDGEVQYSEFVNLVTYMKSGKASFKLSLLLNMLPQGNEVSENAAGLLRAHAKALGPASMRLEARRVFQEMDTDDSGQLDHSEIKSSLRRLGILFVTDGQVRRIIKQFDSNGDMEIDEGEFIAYFGSLYDKRMKGLMGRLFHNVMYAKVDRVSVLRSRKFVERFRLECEDIGATIHDYLDERLLDIAEQRGAHGSEIATGKLDLFNCALRDTHLAPLMETIMAVPIVASIRLNKNYLTDAGVDALLSVLKHQLYLSDTCEGAGGALPVIMPPAVAGWGKMLADEARAAAQEDAPEAKAGDEAPPPEESDYGETGEDTDALSTESDWTVLPSSDSEVEAADAAVAAEVEASILPPVVRKKKTRQWALSRREEARRKADEVRKAKEAVKAREAAAKARQLALQEAKAQRAAARAAAKKARKQEKKEVRKMKREEKRSLEKMVSVEKEPLSPLKNRVERSKGPVRSAMGHTRGNKRSIGLILCNRCQAHDERYTFAYVGLKTKFVRYMDVTSCRACGYEWVDPVHFVCNVELVDYLRPERLLVLAKYRLQTESRRTMFVLCEIRPHSLREIEANYVELLKGHTQEFRAQVKFAGALGRRLARLTEEFARYGREGFAFTENAYFGFTRAHLRQHLAREINAFMWHMRAAFKVAHLPRDRAQFSRHLHQSMIQARANLFKSMDGWTISKQHVLEAFDELQVTHDKLEAYYAHVLRNVSADGMAGGSSFSLLLTQGGVAWAFGDGSDGRTGLATKAPFTRPHILLMARPKYEAYMSNALRVFGWEASFSAKCDVGVVVSNIKAGGVLYFDSMVVPPRFAGMRFRVRAKDSGANVTVRADEVEGLVLSSATIIATPVAEDGEPQWATLEAPAVNQTHQDPRTIVVVFGDNDGCELDWFEWFAEDVDRPEGYFKDNAVTVMSPDVEREARLGALSAASPSPDTSRSGVTTERRPPARSPPTNGRGWP